MLVTVLIKALNEERHIEKCLRSAVDAVAKIGGEVILCDSGSSDRTVEIAAAFPVTILQLKNFAERSCGIGVQIGFSYVRTPFLYVLDGDMEIVPGFFEAAISEMTSNAELAGVAGLVEELGGGNYEFEARKAANDGRNVGFQRSLDMGGLYRTECIRAVGYLTNRNLHSYEEKELGERLLGVGYSLKRVQMPAIRHHGKTDGTAGLLLKRWRSKHLDGSGEWIRAAFGSGHPLRVASYFIGQGVVISFWVILLLSLIVVDFQVWALLLLATQTFLISWFAKKRKGFSGAFVGYVNINVSAAALVRGLIRPQKDPLSVVEVNVLSVGQKFYSNGIRQ